MAIAHVIVRAHKAIAAANRELTAVGMTPSKVPVSEVVGIPTLVKAEVITCLKQPAERLVTLLHNRAAALRADAAELDEIVELLAPPSPLYGAFS